MESRLYEAEAIIGVLQSLSNNDNGLQLILQKMGEDTLAGRVLERIAHTPFGPFGRVQIAEDEKLKSTEHAESDGESKLVLVPSSISHKVGCMLERTQRSQKKDRATPGKTSSSEAFFPLSAVMPWAMITSFLTVEGACLSLRPTSIMTILYPPCVTYTHNRAWKMITIFFVA